MKEKLKLRFTDKTSLHGSMTTLVVPAIRTYVIGDRIEYEHDGTLRTLTNVSCNVTNPSSHPTTLTFDEMLPYASVPGIVIKNYGPEEEKPIKKHGTTMRNFKLIGLSLLIVFL